MEFIRELSEAISQINQKRQEVIIKARSHCSKFVQAAELA
jgi:DNA-binding protein